MTKTKLETLVAEAVATDRAIAALTERLEDQKKLLIAEAISSEDQQAETDGGGWSVTFEGSDGCIARVTQPGPKLKSTIDAEKPAGAKVMNLIGKFKEQLFKPRLTYVPVENFRERAVTLLDGKARSVITACETKSSPQVAFETKDA